MPTDKRFGWIKDKWDDRDKIHPRLYALPQLPNEVNLARYLTPVRNQGGISSCVGFALATNIASVAKKLNIYIEPYSPTWIYNGARSFEGTLNQDIGCGARDGLQWCLEKGCLLEHSWPYDPNHFDPNMPTPAQLAAAKQYKNFTYYRVTDGALSICDALAQEHFVSMGSSWFAKWGPADLPEVTADDQIEGGHEYDLYGYNLTTQRFYGINSWGTNWGNLGLFTMPFSAIGVFLQTGGYDSHYITFEPPGKQPRTITLDVRVS